MTALLLVGMVLGFLLVTVLVYLLGFRLGGQSGISELQPVRAEAAEAERQLHDVTRSAFVAMAEAAERRRFERS